MSEKRILLPAKEAAKFKQILKCYETKQYKKGLKMCEQILKKVKNHGETLSMKGLCLNGLNRKEEAYHFGREGLKYDMNSHVCWHVYGLMYRSDKNYPEAIKCYQNALQHDKLNTQILRDLSSLQIQTRDLEGFKDTRMQLVQIRSQARVSWIGLAMSYHLLQDYKMARDVLQVYEDTLKKSVAAAPGAPVERSVGTQYEHSEMLLYKAMIVEESGDIEQAIKILDENKIDIVDVQAYKAQRSSLLLKAGRFGDAEKSYRDMIDTNPDDINHYLALEACRKGLRGEDTPDAQFRESLEELYREMGEKFPRSTVPKLRLLQVTQADSELFRGQLKKFLQRSLRKGLVSLYASVKTLYADRAKAAVIEEVVEGYLTELKKSGKLSSGEEAEENPATLVYVEYFLVRHHIKCGHLQRALELIESGLSHTPTFLEFYTAKARCYKASGDHAKAADIMDEVRSLDTADRYLNSKCGKYMLRADRPTQAQEIVGLFTREGVDQVDNINEMQCMWFENETGESYLRMKNYGMALKRFHQIEQHFVDINEDQFDFHAYCMRKMTLRSYIQMIRLEDGLRSHSYFKATAMSAIRAYIELAGARAASPTGVVNTSGESGEGANGSGLSVKEQKKLLSKQRREAARAQQAGEATKDNNTREAETKKAQEAVKKEDKDANGTELASTTTPIDEAIKTFLKPLLAHSPNDIDTQRTAAELYMYKKQYVLALKALVAGKQICEDDPGLLVQRVRFALATKDAQLPEVVRKVVDTHLATILDDMQLQLHIKKYQKESSGKSLLHMLAGFQAETLVNGKSEDLTKRAVAALTQLINEMDSADMVVSQIKKVQSTLKTTFAQHESTDEFKQACLEKSAVLALL
ncbi:hypothetical protein SARC_08319 [Sphaeroforma arctica JP610]|uniref:N-alpha-acetyltransferase 15, NatA auxiliary subunit n=1 Tax=Sphaeroforma arctica JP610 TaxID=667725 RepID=A0A0L0FR45_9EUKA|nr:hypothetical protein SARC_08319 [Sphaeroforma arctica JP610]KNC79287.1 hypothetical protein SARC_08319 [Sphaeroforma arctica JP610]|eukprot:XP_014153189.1 hypothetical protein SARC_08319 [Sphaeroforma arctica JP610]